MNPYFQESKLENDYADYLNQRQDYWRINFHFIGFVKKIILVSGIIILRERPAIMIYLYIAIQVVMVVMLGLIKPYILRVLNYLKILSELSLLSILILMIRSLVLFNRLRESEGDPNLEEITQYLHLG